MQVLALTLLVFGPMVTPIQALTDGDIRLQVQLVLGRDGVPINGIEDVVIRLKRDGGVVMWEKTYENQPLDEGVLSVELTGDDDQARALSAGMFDATGVLLAVEVNMVEVELSLVSQPYAIKARMSDEAHSARGLRGVPVQAVSDISNGDVLTYRDGVWVPTGQGDGVAGIASQSGVGSSVESLSDVRISGVNEGDVLRFNGANWVNGEDRVLSAEDVNEIVSDRGYLTEVNGSALEAGAYDQITGIGGKIDVNPVIRLKDDVMIDGSLSVGRIGMSLMPVDEVNVSTLNVGGITIRSGSGRLQVSEGLVIGGRQGEVLSGQGSVNRLGVFVSGSELGSASGLMWDQNQGQLGVGSLSEMDGVKLNVEGDLRVGNQLIVGDEVLDLSSYVVESELSSVAMSGLYSDLTGKPDLSVYLDEATLSNRLGNYYTQTEVLGEIDTKLASYRENEIAGLITTRLSDYETGSERDGKVREALGSYMTREEIGSGYVSNEALTQRLGGYATEAKIMGEILSGYVVSADVSEVGRTGSYNDLEDVPMLVRQSEYVAQNELNASTYATREELSSGLVDLETRVTRDVMGMVRDGYVSQASMREANYAPQSSLDALSDVARSGEYGDLLNVPDLSGYLSGDEISDGYVSEGELVSTMSAYIKSMDVSEVGRTGSFEDLIDEPDMSEYQRVSDMESYLTVSAFNNEMLGVVRLGSGTSIDLSGYAQTTEVTGLLSGYARNDTLSAVATTGEFNDLLGIEDVVREGTLTTRLGTYVTSDDLADERSRIDDAYYDEGELAAELAGLKSEIGEERGVALGGYDTKAEVDGKIEAGIAAFKVGEMSAAINEAVLDKVSESELEISLSSYVKEGTMNAVIEESLTDYMTETKLDDAGYLKVESEQVVVDGDMEVRSITSTAVATMNAVVANTVRVNGDIAFTGMLIKDGYEYEVETIKDGAVVEADIAANAVTSEKIADGAIVNGDISTSAGIAFSKLAMDGANVRSVNPYSGGTGVTVGSDGVIGIGQSVGASDGVTFGGLTVNGNSDFNGNINFTGQLLKNGELYESGAFKKNADGEAYFDSSNVGIGTNDPELKLDINGNLLIRASDSSGSEKGIYFRHGLNTSGPYNISILSHDHSGDNYTDGLSINGYDGVSFSTGSNTRNEQMRINSNGDVGIGVSDPSTKLEVKGDVKATSFIGDGSQLTGISTGKWSDVTGGISYGSNVSVMGDLKMAGTDSYIWTNGSGSGYTGLWDAANGRVAWKYVEGGDLQLLPSAGNVGIGTASPQSKLHVDEARVDITTSGGTGGGGNRFTGLYSPTEQAYRRAQLVLSSGYSDLVIASSQANNNHGSTLTFATYNPSNAGDYKKWVINQGNWGSRKQMLDFGYSDASGRANPHSNINSTDTVLTLDGVNKRVGIGATSPSQKLEVNGNVKASGYFVGGITSSGSGDTNQPFRFSTDYSGWGMIFSEGWTSHNGWGIFWAGNSGAQYGTNGDGGPGNIWGNSGNPNEMAFVGGGDTKWSIHLDNGNVWQKGKIVSMGIDVSNGSVYNSASESKGVWWDGIGDQAYGIYQETGAWSHPYPDLVVGFHTGVKIGGHTSYGGTRFYNDSPNRTSHKILSIGDGGNHVVAHDRIYADNGLHVRGDWLRVNGNHGVYFESHGTGIHSVTADGGQYGSVSTYGNEGGWEGYSIGGRFVFMAKSNEVGLYNDVDNRWLMLFNRGGTSDNARFFNSKTGTLNLRYQHTNGSRYASYDGDSNWDFYSDRRLKKNIMPETNILDRLMNLDVKNYQFINEDKTEKEIGFIAQEVEPFFPSLVTESDDPNHDFKVKALGYSSFGVLAIGGIKELKIEKTQKSMR